MILIEIGPSLNNVFQETLVLFTIVAIFKVAVSIISITINRPRVI